MHVSHNNSHGRIGLRAIASAVFSNFSLMIHLMILAGAFNLWSYNLLELDYLDNSFWLWVSIAWICCTGISSYISVLVGKATYWLDGLLYGYISWASNTVLSCLFLISFTGKLLGKEMTIPFMWGAFGVNLISLGISLYAGYFSTQTEAKIEKAEQIKEAFNKQRRLKTAQSATSA